MAAMAWARMANTVVSWTALTTLRFRLWREEVEPPQPGDLLVIVPRRPYSAVTGPSGWTAERGVFWKVLDEGDGPVVKLTAPYGTEWEAEVWALPAGSYSLPPSDAGSAIPWEPPAG